MAGLKIRRVHANKASFREVELTDGLNIILADRSEESTAHDSRNGVGKSTLIEIIHFCLGSSLTQKTTIYQLKETDWKFGLDLEINGEVLTVTRSFSSPSTVTLSGALHAIRPLQTGKVSLSGEVGIPLRTWKDILGEECFSLDDEQSGQKYSPSFRSLISYFARSGRDAYLEPFTTSRQIRSWQKQVYTAFLVGLNWRHAAEWQVLKDQEKDLKTSSRATAGNVRATLPRLENERLRLIGDQQRLRVQVAGFRVVPEYEAIETEAGHLTAEMRDLANESAILSQMISRYEEQMAAESPGDLGRVREIYKEAGLLFSENVQRELSQVVQFHNEVTANRRDYLHHEITRLRSRSSEIKTALEQKDEERSALLNLLNEGGAVEELGALQFKLGQTQERLEVVERKIAELESTAAEEATVASGRQALLGRALMDRAERRPRWSTVISKFLDATRYLYNEPAEINFGLTENGFNFETKMQRRGSNGVELMAIYSYDISVAQVWQGHEKRPGFLMHDSLLFEGVDERQIALALSYARQQSSLLGFQYIAFINSDNLPVGDLRELGVPWEAHVRLTLGDARPEDALLGYRFGEEGNLGLDVRA
ncbi:DUF2326 domain-containing protein [Streptomyces sp. NPDC006459]|uniref:DUF2326 domain-containing protein n=1 Tax=Streptomyces sp. NPDC006459 TaxID=3154303 RepID=UPI0033BC5299